MIIIDPTFPCPAPCPPCVALVCPGVVAGPVVARPVAEEPVLQLIVGMKNELEAQGLGNVAGTAALEVNGIGLRLTVDAWTNEGLVLDVPSIGLLKPTPAYLYLFDADQQIIAELPVELLTAEMAGIELEEVE